MRLGQLNKVGFGRHAAVGIFGLSSAALAGTGLIGSGRYEHFLAKEITVTSAGNGALRVREVVDYDMARTPRHGYFRNVDNDFGVPVDVSASSPNAPADLDVSAVNNNQTKLRIGNPFTTVNGQHRYVLSYRLPDAKLNERGLSLDVIGTEDAMGTDQVSVVVLGMELDSPQCSVGAVGSVGGCTLEKISGGYRATIENLAPQTGITISGTPSSVQTVSMPSVPPLPTPKKDQRIPLAAGMGVLNAGLSALLFAGARRRGRNEVYAGSAADAAFGNSERATRLVPDSEMASLATTEFAPPKGLEPWEAAVLISERVNNDSPKLWISGMVGKEAMEVEKHGNDLILRKGEKFSQVSPTDQALIQQLVGPTDEFETGRYDPSFARAWASVASQQRSRIDASGWWRRGSPRAKGGAVVVLIILGWIAFKLLSTYRRKSFGGASSSSVQQILASPLTAVIGGAVVALLAALAAYQTLLPSRSAEGSALTIRSESFRRFLDASEGQHVEWAWKNGFLREYSGWAVALGATAGWSKALAQANIPEATSSYSSPFLVYSMGSSFNSTHTAPSSSGSSSGGGGGGGSVGGGGGGGSSGGW
jgi:uncharacterized membrane protein YgcG